MRSHAYHCITSLILARPAGLQQRQALLPLQTDPYVALALKSDSRSTLAEVALLEWLEKPQVVQAADPSEPENRSDKAVYYALQASVILANPSSSYTRLFFSSRTVIPTNLPSVSFTQAGYPQGSAPVLHLPYPCEQLGRRRRRGGAYEQPIIIIKGLASRPKRKGKAFEEA